MAKKKKNGKLFEEVALDWLQSKKTQVKKASYTQYEYLLNSTLLPRIGNEKMEKVCKNLKALMNELSSAGYSDATLMNCLTLIKSVIKYESEQPIDCKFTVDKKSLCVNDSMSEAKKIVAKARDGKCSYKKLGILIIMYTGLGISELCALRWCNIDMVNQIITVNQRLYRNSNGNSGTEIVVEDIDVRRIPINKQFKEIINQYFAGEALEREHFVLTNSANNMDIRTFQMFTKKFFANDCFSKVYTASDLRDLFFINSLKSGVSPIVLAKNTGVTLSYLCEKYGDLIYVPDSHFEMSKLVY